MTFERGWWIIMCGIAFMWGALLMAQYDAKKVLPLYERIRFVEDRWYDCAAHINNAAKRKLSREPWSHYYRRG